MTQSWCRIPSWIGNRITIRLVILGSARPNRDPRRAVDIAFPSSTAKLVVLAQHHIGGYEYAHANAEDDFGAAANAMHAADKVIFAISVY